MQSEPARLLILAKTYPVPSTKYRETSCVVALTDSGELRRLYPVPFRLLTAERQFAKWEWITARVSAPNDDRRPESRRIDADSIARSGIKISTGNGWANRMELIAPHVVESFEALDHQRQESGKSLGVLHISRLVSLEILKSRSTSWTANEIALMSRQGLFDADSVRNRVPLEKLPYTFHYGYEIDTATGTEQLRHPILDWEIGQAYRQYARDYGDQWELKLRERFEGWMKERDLYVLLGNMHRLPDQWMIVGLIYPPRNPQRSQQLSLSL